MNQFLKNIIIYIFPLVISLLLLEYFVSNVPSTYSFKKDLLFEQQDSLQTLIIGSSSAMNGIDPKFLDTNAFNIGYYSEDHYYSYKILEYYIRNTPQLKSVILGTTNSSLDYQLVSGPEFWRSKFYHDNYNISKNVKSVRINDYSYVYTYGIKKSLKMLFNPKSNISKIQNTGWQKLEATKNKSLQFEKVDSTNYYNQLSERKANIENNKYWFDKIATLCENNNTSLIIVLMPIYDESVYGLPDEVLRKYNEVIKNIISKYNNVKLLDFSKDTQFGIDDFRDS